jgi:uncharacterized protein (TIGR02449 family)
MGELLQGLEVKLKALIDSHVQLKEANQQLLQSKTLVVHEKDILLAKQQKAIAQIETLVSRLKAIEDVA